MGTRYVFADTPGGSDMAALAVLVAAEVGITSAVETVVGGKIQAIEVTAATEGPITTAVGAVSGVSFDPVYPYVA